MEDCVHPPPFLFDPSDTWRTRFALTLSELLSKLKFQEALVANSTGKQIRLNRLIQKETNTCIICAIDHGMTSPVFLDGLFDTKARVHEAIEGGANVLMLGRGVVKDTNEHFHRDTSLALMLTASAAGRPS